MRGEARSFYHEANRRRVRFIWIAGRVPVRDLVEVARGFFMSPSIGPQENSFAFQVAFAFA